MDNYQNEMFKFVTERNNFESLTKLMEHYEIAKRELIKNFWTSVTRELSSKIDGSSWELKVDPNIFGTYSKLQMYKTTWKNGPAPLVSITWENLAYKPFRGLLVHMDSKGFDMALIRTSAIAVAPSESIVEKSAWWAWWRSANVEFSDPKGLAEILPDKSDQTAKQWANDLYELAVSHENQIDEIIKTARTSFSLAQITTVIKIPIYTTL